MQIATVAVFLGRAWQHIFWDPPFRTLLWEEDLMKGIVQNWWGMTWEEYASSPAVDHLIQQIIKGFGWFYFACALVAALIHRIPKWLGISLLLGVVGLIFLAACYMKVYFFSLGQFLEYVLQFSSPIFLYLLRYHDIPLARLTFWMKIAIALTFVCHGLYAVGYYPRPGNFVQMVLNTIGGSEEFAVQFLRTVGMLDFIVGALIFFPDKAAKPALIYAVFWGFMTTVARIWANFYSEFWLDSLHQWTPEAVYRVPHFLVPLAVWWFLKFENSENLTPQANRLDGQGRHP